MKTIPSLSALALMRGNVARIVIGGGCLGMTACCSIVSKSQYPVTISSNPPGACFTIKKANGVAMSTGITPATITLSSSFGYFQPAKYIVEFNRKGVTQSMPLNAGINGWYFATLCPGELSPACSSLIRLPVQCGDLMTQSLRPSTRLLG